MQMLRILFQYINNNILMSVKSQTRKRKNQRITIMSQASSYANTLKNNIGSKTRQTFTTREKIKSYQKIELKSCFCFIFHLYVLIIRGYLELEEHSILLNFCVPLLAGWSMVSLIFTPYLLIFKFKSDFHKNLFPQKHQLSCIYYESKNGYL